MGRLVSLLGVNLLISGTFCKTGMITGMHSIASIAHMVACTRSDTVSYGFSQMRDFPVTGILPFSQVLCLSQSVVFLECPKYFIIGQ